MEPLHFSHHYTLSMVQWVNLLLPAQAGSDSRLGDAPTLTMEPGSPVGDVSPHYIPL